MRAGSHHATISAVARFLGWERTDVARAIQLDGLPAVALPTAQKTVRKIYLPSFHRWWLERCQNADEAMRSYEAFRRTFCGGGEG